jgi:hypothetical protein
MTAGLAARAGRLLANPHAVLALGVVLVAGCEYGREELRWGRWAFVEMVIGALALALVWRSRERLRLAPVLAVALALDVVWIVSRAHATLGADVEWRIVYARQGQMLLDGSYPHSEYPAGAVSLFALEAWLGGTDTHFVHAFLMVPFQIASVAALWSLRTRWSPWLAAVLAFWPLNAWFWEYRFDLVPTGLLLAGLAFAWRRSWLVAGILLGLGTAAKWSPGLAAVALLAYLLFAREWRGASRLVLGSVGAFAAVYVPYLAWSPDAVLDAYSFQGGRSITGESVWHLLLRPLGVEGRADFAFPQFDSVRPPGWADAAAIVVQIALLVGVAWLSARARSLRAVVALAAMMPVVFLVANRVFSVQYFVLLLAAWLFAAALLVRSERETVGVTVVALAATAANVLILPYPLGRPHVWEVASLVRFVLGIGLTVWLVVRASRLGPAPERSQEVPGRLRSEPAASST